MGKKFGGTDILLGRHALRLTKHVTIFDSTPEQTLKASFHWSFTSFKQVAGGERAYDRTRRDKRNETKHGLKT